MWKSIFISLALLSPCAALSEGSQSSDRLKVGLIIPLTGPLAEYGQAFQNGVNLAKHNSDAVSKNCNFLAEDSKYDSNTAVAAFQKFTSSDGTPVIYTWGGKPSDAVAPLADRKNVALFVWSADPKVSEGRKQVIRFSNSGADYGAVLAEYLFKKGYKTVGIVKTENQYIEAIRVGLEQAAADKFKVEVIDSYPPSEVDFRPTITKIKARHLDALGVFLISGQVSNFFNQLTAQQLKIPVFGTDFFESMTEVEQSHGGMVGSVFANNEVTPDFRDVYVKKFGNDLQINHAANGYDFAIFLCASLKPSLKDFSPNEILSKAQAVTSFAGKQGTAVFTTSNRADKYFKFPVVMRKITASEIITEKPSGG